RLSVQHAFPKLHALEQRYGSLLVGQFLGARERRRRAEKSKQDARKISFDDGLQVLVEALERSLAGAIRLHAPVVRLRRAADAGAGESPPRTAAGDRLARHAAVVFAGPAYKLPEIRLVSDHYINVAPLSAIPYPPVSSLVLGFRRDQVAHPLDGFGMLIP